MKKVIFGLLSIASIAFTSCEKEAVASNTIQEATEVAPAFDGSSDRQAITAAQLNGKYQLKYGNTKADRTWKPEQNVGLSFFPGTFYYSTNILSFNATTGKVALSAKSILPDFPDASFGSLKFTVSGESLKIVVGNGGAESGSANLKVRSLSSRWLVLEDVRTGLGWAFLRG
jgi:hypothetical protein